MTGNASAFSSEAIRTLRRPGHAQEPRAGAHLSQQPLRLAQAAWIAEIGLDRLGRESLFEHGATDNA